MLSTDSSYLLKQVLDMVSETEIVIESLRQQLAHDNTFSPYTAFCRLDRSARERINAADLIRFLKEIGIMGVGIGDCSKLLKFFDCDTDGSINFNQFLQMILPCECTALRNEV